MSHTFFYKKKQVIGGSRLAFLTKKVGSTLLTFDSYSSCNFKRKYVGWVGSLSSQKRIRLFLFMHESLVSCIFSLKNRSVGLVGSLRSQKE